jgi:hypothetical protein
LPCVCVCVCVIATFCVPYTQLSTAILDHVLTWDTYVKFHIGKPREPRANVGMVPAWVSSLLFLSGRHDAVQKQRVYAPKL